MKNVIYLSKIRFIEINPKDKMFMKKFFLIVVAAVFICSCGNSYIEDYVAICDDAKEQVDAASSVKEVMSIMRQMRKDIKELNDEYPEAAERYKSAEESDGAVYKDYKRRMKAMNEVNALASAKRRELLKKKK